VKGRARRTVAALTVGAAAFVWADVGALRQGLTGATDIARAYDAILDADFATARTRIDALPAFAPAPAAAVLAPVATWWRIQLDPESRALDPRFLREVDQAVAATSAWTDRDPARAEAWFYLGASYASRVQWRVLRGEKIAAARDGKRIKDALERAIELDPELHDAYFGIGLYHYYADVAPAAAKVLRWLLFLPGGDRAQGLREMLEARDRGELLRGEADFQLHLLYLWYEQQPRQALDLLEGLRTRYPHNPLFLARLAEVYDVYVHDHAVSLELYRELLTLARDGRVNEPALAEAYARLGLADQLDELAEPDRAIATLRPLADRSRAAGQDSAARAHLRIGILEDRMGRHDVALRAYQAAVAAVSGADPYGVRDRARIEERRSHDPRAGEAMRLSIAGWRAVERGELAVAEPMLRRAAELRPRDPVVQYRLGRLLAAQEDNEPALACFRLVIEARPAAPPTFLAHAYYEAGRVYESMSRRMEALDMYAAARDVELADRATHDAAARAIRRLQH
jgi:tetratricopeptide (TPR) repeat protein